MNPFLKNGIQLAVQFTSVLHFKVQNQTSSELY